MEALHEVAAHVFEHLGLFERLHTLGDDGRVQALQHADDRAEHHAAAILVHGRTHESHIELHHVHRHVFEHVERREPAAEVVHLHEHFALTHTFDHLIQAVGLLNERTLRHLEVQATHGQVVFALQFEEVLEQAVFKHLDARDVYRYGHRLAVGHVAPPAGTATRLLPHKEVEPVNLAAVLQHGNELRGTDPPELGMLPTCERLRADDLSVHVVNLWLVPHLYLAVCQRVVDGLLDGDAPRIALEVLVGERHEAAPGVLMRVTMRDRGAVQRLLEARDVIVLLAQEVHTRREEYHIPDVLVVGPSPDLLRQPLEGCVRLV